MEDREVLRRAIKDIREDGCTEHVNLDSKVASDEDLIQLGKALEKNTSLNSLSLHNASFSHTALEKFCSSVQGNLRMVELDLSYNFIGPAGLKSLASCLCVNESLTSVKLNYARLTAGPVVDDEIDVSGLVQLAKALTINTALSCLELAGNSLTDYGEQETGLSAILTSMNRHPELKVVDLSFNGLGTSGAALLSRILVKNHKLQELYLRGNRIQADGANHIATLLRENKTLCKLDIRENDLCISLEPGTGIFAVFECLRSHIEQQHPLGKLSIQSGNNTLWYLDLRGNRIVENPSVYDAAEELLCFNSTLVDFRLDEAFSETTDPSGSGRVFFCPKLATLRLMVNEELQRVLGNPKGVKEGLRKADEAFKTSGEHLLHRVIQFGSCLCLWELVPHLDAEHLVLRERENLRTPLHFACLAPERWILQLLAESQLRHGGANIINVADRNGNTGLHYAMRNGDLPTALFLVELGASILLKNRSGKVALDMCPVKQVQQEVIKSAGRSDVIVICTSDFAEKLIARELVQYMRKHHGLTSTVLTTSDTLDSLQEPQFYCSTVIAVIGPFSSSCHSGRQSLCQVVSLVRKHAGWFMKRLLPRSGVTEDEEGQNMAPLLVASFDVSDFSVLSDPAFLESSRYDVSSWASPLVPHRVKEATLEEKAQESSNGIPPEKKLSTLQKLSTKRFRRSLLMKLKEEEPIVGEAELANLEDLALRVQTNKSSRHQHALYELANSIGEKHRLLELELLLKSKGQYVFLLDMECGANLGIIEELRKRLDEKAYASWLWPSKSFSERIVLANNQGIEPHVDTLVWEGLRRAKGVVLFRSTQNMIGPSVLHPALQKIIDKSCEVLATRKPGAPATVTVTVLPGQLSLEAKELAQMPLLSVIRGTTDAERESFLEATKTGPFFLELIRQIGVQPRVTPSISNRDHAGSQLEAIEKIQALEKALAQKDKQLEASRLLNCELAANAEYHRRRLASTVQVLTPPKSAQGFVHLLHEVGKEQLRMRVSNARPNERVETSILARCGELSKEERERWEAVLSGQQDWTKGELCEFLRSRELALKREIAAVKMQSVWRSCFTRELLRRKRDDTKARVIQRAFRRYRYKALAWMY